jgi:N-acyl-D-amino-acid deacylase
MSRIGSNSKVLTAIALLQLKEQGRLDLDAKFLDILTEYQVQPGGDARLRDITVRHLMHHAGGWDRRLSGDAMFLQTAVASALNVPMPVTCSDFIRYMMGRPLDFTPGTRAAYSNFGFCILGRVVEKVSGEPYELYVRNHVLAPMAIQDMSIGYSHLSERGPKEVKYYETYQMPSVYPGEGSVQAAYGGVDMVANDSCGGWIASAIDLTRFLTALDGSRATAPLAAATMAEFTANPNIPGLDSATSWYGLGIFAGPTPQTWWHGGSIPGSTSQMVRDVSGYSWAGFVDSQTSDPGGIFNDLNQAMIRALGTGFPGSSTDLYSQYPSPELPARYH